MPHLPVCLPPKQLCRHSACAIRFPDILAVLGMCYCREHYGCFVGICGALNAAGAIGDMWVTMIVLRYAPTAYVMDEPMGCACFPWHRRQAVCRNFG